jgi:prephenate dehydrogenase
MAAVSHLPQIAAVALMNAAGDRAADRGLAMAGPALREMTRLAESPADLWQGIFESNADFVFEAVQALVAALPASAESLEDGTWASRAFAQARARRARLEAGGS